ncbi:MAG: phage BR0599 family protein [Candidatus Omnitrophica bacterium]|nr:phage BR0599 family protein [Candidatus Omnitrophota bacterium]
MRDELTTEFKNEAAEDQNRPIELYDIYLGDQETADSETRYFCTNNRPLNFWNLDSDVKAYLPLGIKRSAIPVSNQLEVEAVSSELDNVDRLWSNLLATVELRGKRVVIRKVFLDLLTDETHAKVMFDGILNGISELTETSVKLECRSKIKSLDVETGVMQQLYCNYIFGDEFCGFDAGSTGVTDQSVDGGSTTTEIIDAARGEADDYWNDGVISFTSGNNSGQKRKVVDFINADKKNVLDYALPHEPQPGDTYDLEQGCDKAYATCKNRFNNHANYEGNLHLPPLINPKL